MNVDLFRIVGVWRTWDPIVFGHIMNTSYLETLQYGVFCFKLLLYSCIHLHCVLNALLAVV